MGTIILLILAYGLIGIGEITPLYQEREYGKLIVYALFFSLAFVISVLLCSGVEFPSPAGMMEKLVSTLIGGKKA